MGKDQEWKNGWRHSGGKIWKKTGVKYGGGEDWGEITVGEKTVGYSTGHAWSS